MGASVPGMSRDESGWEGVRTRPKIELSRISGQMCWVRKVLMSCGLGVLIGWGGGSGVVGGIVEVLGSGGFGGTVESTGRFWELGGLWRLGRLWRLWRS